MRSFLLALVSLVGVLVASSATAAIAATTTAAAVPPSLPARAVPVYEATRKPSVVTDYLTCGPDDRGVFEKEIAVAVRDCGTKTTYAWDSDKLATAAQRRELCNCTELIQQLQQVTVPRCTVTVDGNKRISYARHFSYAFELCAAPRTITPRTFAPEDTAGGETTTSSSNTVVVVGGIVGALVVCVLIGGFLIYKRKQKSSRQLCENGESHVVDEMDTALAGSPISDNTKSLGFPYMATVSTPNKSSSTYKSSTGGDSRGGIVPAATVHMWDDPMIIAVRIPHDMIFFGPLLASGGYGEVYKGTYKGVTVAIKQLLPARRKDLVQIDAFLGEIKLMSQLDHERIVRFIGVAWNSLSDACAVVEYVENGDLRSVLTRWDGDEEQRPQGFDPDKIKIALHIAHALTYLHSLQPVVVHRDLKSKNILLNKEYDAKLTDFGVSRERADSTMTAGVGSSLWMAPEVMIGERYDEKADVFSFGVVLSELDSHQLPYSRAREMGTNHKLPDPVILQMVALGKLSISFSEYADGDLVSLGRDCVSLDPKKRPSAAQVLHRVHQVARFAS